MIKPFFLFVFIISLATSNKAQDESGSFFAGINVGGLLANKQTAIMYTGASNIARYGIEDIFDNPYYTTAFTNYFQYPYSIVELPSVWKYKPVMDIGAHLGLTLGNGSAIFLEVNFSNVKLDDMAFTVAIEDPNNQSPEPTYDQIPIFGGEKRLNVNFGIQIGMYNEDGVTVYLPLFANLNSVRLEENYFIINNVRYQILHTVQGQTNIKPGGIGFGGGTGLGAKYRFNDKFTFDLAYSLYYNKTKMNEDFAPWGVQHGITFRIILG